MVAGSGSQLQAHWLAHETISFGFKWRLCGKDNLWLDHHAQALKNFIRGLLMSPMHLTWSGGLSESFSGENDFTRSLRDAVTSTEVAGSTHQKNPKVVLVDRTTWFQRIAVDNELSVWILQHLFKISSLKLLYVTPSLAPGWSVIPLSCAPAQLNETSYSYFAVPYLWLGLKLQLNVKDGMTVW